MVWRRRVRWTSDLSSDPSSFRHRADRLPLVQPWMIIAALILIGFVILLVAPTWHRRSIQNSREEAAARKRERARSFQQEETTEAHLVNDAASAVRARDALLLRGVRSEVIEADGQVVLLATAADRDTVRDVLDAGR